MADAVLPRDTVGKKTFGYYEYPIEQAYTIPSTLVGEHSSVPRSEFTGTQQESRCLDYGHEVVLTRDDIDNAPKNVDPREKATERATNIVVCDRERRVAELCFNAAKYPSSNKVDVSGTAADLWSDYTQSNPLPYIIEKLDSCLVRPNVMVFGQATWNKLSMHPKIVKAANGNDGGEGRATRQRLAELLEVSEILVGAAFINTVKQGKTPVLTRMWGKHALAFYRDRTAGATGGMTFGFTAQYGERIAGAKEADIGLRGGVAVRSGESVRELIVAPHAAFFFQNAIA